jgi:pyruvate formate lyase activating enzyme
LISTICRGWKSFLTMNNGIVFDIRRYAIHDGPGIRTTVFLKGCPLSCAWCHNPEGIPAEAFPLYRKERCIGCGACIAACSQNALRLSPSGIVADGERCNRCGACATACPAGARELVGTKMTVAQVIECIGEDILFYDASGGGVTFSGGEPLMQPAFLLSLLSACGDRAIHRVVDTSGFAARALLEKAAGSTNLFLYDLKHLDPEIHRTLTGVSNELILENLKHLSAGGVGIRIRIPLIPGINDDHANLDRTGDFLNSLPRRHPVDLLPYHNRAQGKYRRFERAYAFEKCVPPSEGEIEAAAERLRRFGLEVHTGG